jgi:AraC-type DNA-binding domain-containing proteins
MKVHSEGVLPASNIFFYTPSNQARKLFFWIVCTGHYFCDARYMVDRKRYDSFLVLYVVRGKGFVENDGPLREINEGSFAFIDCYKPHRYFTKTGWEILWMHFDGKATREYFESIVSVDNPVITPPSLYFTERKLQQIYGLFSDKGKISEPRVSQYILTIITEFYISASEASQPESRNIIEEILPYISENLDKQLSVEQLAEKACLSPFYFSRVFKRETGLTPHKYIIVARIDMAKFFLRTTDYSVKKISLNCGFTSVCNFCSSFKQITGIAPLTYRSKSSAE